MSSLQTSYGSVLVAGLGKSGLAACRYLLQRPELFDALTVIDEREQPTFSEELHLGEVSEKVLTLFGQSELDESAAFDLAIVSPGIAPHTALYQSIQRASRRVISEIEFAFERQPHNWIAITGTNGKTTTTALTTHVLRAAGKDARSVGNIGAPAIEVVGEASDDTIFVAEVSSFQLHAIDSFKPRVAMLLNITPDHINWHGSFEAYTEDKTRVFENAGQGDVIVMNGDDESSLPFVSRAQETGARVELISLKDGELSVWTSAENLLIKGPHNIANALFAAHAARAFGVDDATITRGLESFAPVEHRLQFVETIDGVSYFNDSKATNPDAVFKALSAFETEGILLLVGGRNKGNRFVDLARYAFAKPNFRAALCFGEAGEVIYNDFLTAAAEAETSALIERIGTMNDALQRAHELAASGDCVLLSPACASFDEFTSFEHRGEVFMELVAALPGER